jgi:hypothetical protein
LGDGKAKGLESVQRSTEIETELVVVPLANLDNNLSVPIFHLNIRWVRQLTTTIEVESKVTVLGLVWLLVGKGE